jgi:hypothetical protein
MSELQVLHSRWLNRLYSDAGVMPAPPPLRTHPHAHPWAQVTSYVLHPGNFINTDIGRDGGAASKIVFAMASPFTKSIAQGA